MGPRTGPRTWNRLILGVAEVQFAPSRALDALLTAARTAVPLGASFLLLLGANILLDVQLTP